MENAENKHEMLPKPDELLALHSIAKRLFDTLKNWFEIEPKVTIDLAEVDSAVIELSSPHMIIAMAMRKLQALHLIAIISWMAGLLYLPRIFVYHEENKNDKSSSNIFKVMERKLYYYIMMPAMLLSWFFGLLLIGNIGFDQLLHKWLQIKLLLVILLTIYHLFLGYCLKKFSLDVNSFSSKFYRIFNEVPTILLILIVFIVIFKPI